MFCSNCGAELNGGASFCGGCGTAVNLSPIESHHNSGKLIGFSEKINHPAFKEYKKKSVIWSFLFAGILFVIAVIGIPIYGNASGDIEWPGSLLYGVGIGCMFLVIAFLQTLKRGLDSTWDGVVEYKDSYTLKERSRNGYIHYHTVYILKIKKDTGGTKKHKWRDVPGVYGYYNTGDRVRHHKGFSYYEKYDKSSDTRIMCAACMSFQDIDSDICQRCKCPLLK